MKQILFLFAVLLGLVSCSDDNDPINPIVNPSPKEQWGQTLAGNDGTIFAYPDLYVNYWEYT